MSKKLNWLVGFINHITEVEAIKIDSKKTIYKALLTFETEDGQVAYFEIRKKVIDTIKTAEMTSGSKVKIGYVFMGSSKGDKVYNNLYINEIAYAD